MMDEAEVDAYLAELPDPGPDTAEPRDRWLLRQSPELEGMERRAWRRYLQDLTDQEDLDHELDPDE